mgnify:CR=1 FL=1
MSEIPTTARPDGAGRAPAGMLGMRLFIASLAMVFAATLVGYLVVRARAESWPPPGVPLLPGTLWISTAILLASSVTMAWAGRGVRRGDQRALRAGLVLTSLLGVAFLVSQTLNWFALVAANLTMRTNLYGFTFYLLTGLHALHVLGGLGPLAVVTRNAFAGKYSAAAHAGVAHVSLYWHFLDAVWIVMFAVLLLAA